ncbi:glutathione-disulfide reductase [Kushneria phosphatilytica]|uniref:Glutathione-disulfide reductase n=1 Tax=Kushneria phosphatilytica TaxID=657387 RepID=A0A1S1NVE4_9GAMM|nr:glutathione-disulfide reductase [Kushneria phosphatilytica]OHV11931.1 glutathione-disulfide reductase [Kushneria phosphatilytica]QEL11113.1 glutathione-disulfide reductase [Kushneria phosphatilytica]
MSDHDFDLFVIGAGSGGVRAARTAAQHGKRVAIAEDRHLGGTCVNVGCVPKKLYSYAAHFSDAFHDSAGFGWQFEQAPTFHWPTLRDNKTREIERLNGIYEKLLVNAGVELIRGRAQIVDAHGIEINGQRYSAERILIATGGQPWIPEFEGRDHLLDSDRIFNLERFPKRFLVMGGGYIAVEFASIFNGLGAETHLVYRGPLFLRGFDYEIREFTRDEMLKKGVNLHFETTIDQVEARDNVYDVTLSNGKTLEVDVVLGATGRRPRFEGLGLENVEVEFETNGKLRVDDRYQTATPSILALGDITEGPELTPVALEDAMRLVELHFGSGEAEPIDYDSVATAVFCHPNIGTVGLSEEEAREQHEQIRVYTTNFRPMRHTLSGSDERCLMKLIVDDYSDRVLGAHMVGEEAGELIQGLAIAVRAGLTKHDFDATVGVHPTSAEEFVTLRQVTRT